MTELVWFADALGLLLFLGVAYLVSLFTRRRWIGRHGGTFDFSLRLNADEDGRGWALGIGRYSGKGLVWFRTFSLNPRPARSWTREQLVFEARRERNEAEEHALYSDHVILVCRGPEGPIEIAMALSAVTGFLAWLEAGPPGRGSRPHI
jgi:hypothetical protein